MTPDPSDELAAALADYLAAMEAGTPKDRAAFLSEYAHLADDLPALLAQLEQVQGVTRAADFAVPTPIPMSLPHVVGEFQLVRVLGRGGMGVVYEAEHPTLRRRVAVKVLPTPDPATRDRVLHEARVAALLVHPHVVPVYAAGQGSGFAYIVFRYIDGRPLSDLLQSPVPSPTDPLADPRQVVSLIANVADALGFAHDRGILHRDVKPGNLLLDTGGHLWLTDFGLARSINADVTAGDRAGTPRYMAPELLAEAADRTRVGPEADVYALGVTLYELLARRKAFNGETNDALRANIKNYHLTPLTRLAPHVPADLANIVHRAIARLPADRYPSGAAMAADLRRFLAGQPVAARPLSAVQRGWRWAGRHKRGFAVATVVLLLGLVATAGVGLWGYTKEMQAREELETREAILRELVAEVNKSEQVYRHLPQGQAEHRRLVRVLKETVCRWADEPKAKRETKIEAVRACLRLAEVAANTNLQDDALAAMNDSLSRVTALQATDERDPTVRFLTGETHKMLAGQLLSRGNLGDAKAHGLQADRLFRGLIAEDPNRANFRNPISLLYSVLSRIAASEGRREEEQEWLRKGLEQDQWLAARFPDHPQSYIRLACSWVNYGDCLLSLGDPKATEDAFREAKKCDDLLRQSPAFSRQKKDRVFSCSAPVRLISHLIAMGKLDEAGELLAVAVPDLDALADEYADEITFIERRALAHYLMGQCHFLNGRTDAAKDQFRAAITHSADKPRVNVVYRSRLHHRQPFAELVDPARTQNELAELSRVFDPTHQSYYRLQASVGANDPAAFEATRNTPLRAEYERDAALLRAVYLARRGDLSGAKAALPPTAPAIDGWDAICRKIVRDVRQVTSQPSQ